MRDAGSCRAELMVRIHLSPAVSQVRTCLSRELPSNVEKPRFFAGVRARGERRGRQIRAGRGNIGPTGGNISVGPYSSTGPPVDVGGLMIPVVFEFGIGNGSRARLVRYAPSSGSAVCARTVTFGAKALN